MRHSNRLPLIRSEGAADNASFGNLSLAPRQLVLFPNGFKADAPDKNCPDCWGAFNPGQGQPIARITAWTKKDRNQHAMLAGATSYPLPGKSEVQQQDAAPDLKDLVDECAVNKSMPRKGRGRKDAGSRA